MSKASQTFEFGRNWQSFVERCLNDETITNARKSFVELLGTSALGGVTVLDIGCGSGLSSLVAHRLGALRVVSFDVDALSVRTCQYLREHEGCPDNWQILHGSILDEDFTRRLGRFDLVYAWGVLHHTGAMWEAVDRASQLVAPQGRFALAIYNRADALGLYPDGRFGPSRLWIGLKRAYCRLPRFLQSLVAYGVMSIFVASLLVRLRNPHAGLRDYRQQRGMSLLTDIRDWMGGFPYEYASVDEVFDFLRQRGFDLHYLKVHGGLRCNEFLFQRSAFAESNREPTRPTAPRQSRGSASTR